jgi:hypothetical protein
MKRVQVDAHVDATRGILLLSSKQVPGYVRRVVLRRNRKNDLHRMMRIFRAEAEVRLMKRGAA